MKITHASPHIAAPIKANPRPDARGNVHNGGNVGVNNIGNDGVLHAARQDVALSPAALQLSALGNGAGDIDAARVAQLRAAIASGQVRVDATRIADSILASTRELLK